MKPQILLKQQKVWNLSDDVGTYLTAGDELIDDALSCVGEVSELRLPNDQSVGVGHGEAQIEAKHAVLWEERQVWSIKQSWREH